MSGEDRVLFVISKRRLVIKEIRITENTFIKAREIFKTVFSTEPRQKLGLSSCLRKGADDESETT